jgi:hypothetical protein
VVPEEEEGDGEVVDPVDEGDETPDEVVEEEEVVVDSGPDWDGMEQADALTLIKSDYLKTSPDFTTKSATKYKKI